MTSICPALWRRVLPSRVTGLSGAIMAAAGGIFLSGVLNLYVDNNVLRL